MTRDYSIEPLVRDRFHLVFIVFVLLGVATLLPWSIFMTEKEYFDVRLHQPPYQAAIADHFISVFGLTFNTASLFTNCALMGLAHWLTPNHQMLYPMLVTLCILVATAVLAVETDVPGTVMAYLTLGSIAIVSVTSTMLQVGSLTLAAELPSRCMQALLSGMALSGVAASVVSLLSQMRADVEDSGAEQGGRPTAAGVAPAALTYFTAGAVVTALCVGGLCCLGRLEYAKEYLGPDRLHRRPAALRRMQSLPDMSEPLLLDILTADAAAAAEDAAAAVDEPKHDAIFGMEAGAHEEQAALMHKPAAPPHPFPPHTFLVYAASLGLCLTITLSVFPGVTGFVCSVRNPASRSPCDSRTPNGSRLFGDLFAPVVYVVFNVADFAGRLAAGYGPWSRTAPTVRNIVVYSLSRIAVAVLLLHCHVITPHRWRMPELFHSDVAPVALTAVLGISNGHLMSTTCMHAPQTMPPQHRGRFGPIAALATGLGSFIGSSINLGVMYALQSSDG